MRGRSGHRLSTGRRGIAANVVAYASCSRACRRETDERVEAADGDVVKQVVAAPFRAITGGDDEPATFGRSPVGYTALTAGRCMRR